MRFYEKKYAVLYERRMLAEGYPGNLLDIVEEELNSVKSVIDVGAGTGFFSIPLAEKGCRIIAVEPSEEMAKLLRGKINDKVSRLVEVNISRWEDWPARKAESLICVHSIYGIKDIKSAVVKMKQCSDKSVIIIGSNDTRTLSGIIRGTLKDKKSRDDLSDALPAALNEAGISYVSRAVDQIRDIVFTDIKEEADYHCFWNGIDNSKHGLIEDIIRKNSVNSAGEFTFRNVYKDTLFIF